LGAQADSARPVLNIEQHVVLLGRHVVACLEVRLAGSLTPTQGLRHLGLRPASALRLRCHGYLSLFGGVLPAQPVFLLPGPFFELALPPLSSRPGSLFTGLGLTTVQGPLPAISRSPAAACTGSGCPAQAGSRRTRRTACRWRSSRPERSA